MSHDISIAFIGAGEGGVGVVGAGEGARPSSRATVSRSSVSTIFPLGSVIFVMAFCVLCFLFHPRHHAAGR